MRRLLTLVAFLGLPTILADAQTAQTSSKPIFTDYPPYLCVGGGFVAMAGIGLRDPLVVITIDVNGIETPQTIPAVGDEVLGMQCSSSRIELLVRDDKSGRLITPLYAVQWQFQRPSTIHEEQREDLNLPKTGPVPPAISFRKDSLQGGKNRAGGYARGDWYVWVSEVVDRPNNAYEVHFVSSHDNQCGSLVVTLLEESQDKKVIRSVPLVHIEGCSD
jgi:hypothetical protein